MKYVVTILALLAGLTAAGCGPEQGKPTDVTTVKPVKLCPYNLPVCVGWSPSAGIASQAAKPPPGTADRAWEKFQELLHFRPDNPAFRMMGGLLNTQFGNWQEMIVIEYLDRPGGGRMDDLNYGFMILARTGGGFMAMTNFLQPDQFEFDLKARPIKQLDGELAEQCFTTLQAASESLPSALAWQAGDEAPTVVLHYLPETGKPWACAVHDKAAIPAILGQDTTILKKEASNSDVIEALAKRDPSGKSLSQEFADAVCGPADAERYEKVRNRYTAIISGVWSISVGMIRIEPSPHQSGGSGKHSDEPASAPVRQSGRPANPPASTPAASQSKVAPAPAGQGTTLKPAETKPVASATAPRGERLVPVEPATAPASKPAPSPASKPATSPASQPQPVKTDATVLGKLTGRKLLLVLVESQASNPNSERIQAALTGELNKRLTGSICESTVDYAKLKEFRDSTPDFSTMRIGQIGRKFSADAVLYVQLTDIQVKSSQNLWQGKLAAEIKLVDSDGKRIWPAEPAASKSVKPGELTAADNSSSDYSDKFVDELVERLAENVMKLLAEPAAGK